MIFAYLDAGTGSLVIQTVLGGAAGLAVLFRSRYARFRGKRLKGVESEDQASETAQSVESKEQSAEV